VVRIEQLSNTVVDTVKTIQKLGQTSQQIGEITETITSIADQTNLLALNAAIEAAPPAKPDVDSRSSPKKSENWPRGPPKRAEDRRFDPVDPGRYKHAVEAIDISSREVQEAARR
jgi:hypothetical protein